MCQADTPRRDPQVPNPMSEAAVPEAPRGPPPPVPVSSQHNSASYAIPPSPNMSEMSSWSSTRLSSPSVAHIGGQARRMSTAFPAIPRGSTPWKPGAIRSSSLASSRDEAGAIYQLSQDGSKDSEGYRKWLMAHAQSSQGQCRDLGRYLVRMFLPQHAAGKSLPYVPGTTSVRSFVSYGKQPVKGAGSHDSRPRARLPEAEDRHSNEILMHFNLFSSSYSLTWAHNMVIRLLYAIADPQVQLFLIVGFYRSVDAQLSSRQSPTAGTFTAEGWKGA